MREVRGGAAILRSGYALHFAAQGWKGARLLLAARRFP